MTLPLNQPFSGKMISHYQLDSFLGSGGMGTVWKAQDLGLKRPVAIKLLSGIREADRSSLERFQLEARAAAALDHAAVCTVYEIGEAEGVPFIAMAFIEGQTVAKKVHSGALDIAQALRIAAEVADGLEAAHSRGIVHRDIKAANIMVTPQGSAKILDFGVARMGFSSGLTVPGTVMGTPCYMSPEHVNGQPLDRRTDLWSLGVLLYEMLAGKLPFHGDNIVALVKAIHAPPPSLRALRSDVPEEVERIVYKALARSTACGINPPRKCGTICVRGNRAIPPFGFRRPAFRRWLFCRLSI